MTKENVNLENVKICRFCMTHIENNAFICNIDLKDGGSLKDIIRNCLLEVDVNTLHASLIFELCLSGMERLHDFKKTCHEVEPRIKNYYKMAASHSIPRRISLKFNNSKTPIGIEKGYLDAENAVMCPENEDIISIKCEEIHIKHEEENDVQTDDFDELRDCNSSGDSRSSQEATEIRTSASKGKKYFCYKCHYSSDKNNNMTRHMLTHSDDEVHECTLCNFITNARLSLQAHMASHRGPTKRYGCPECTYEIDHKGSIDQHILKHKDNSEVKMNKCPSCPYKTKYKSTLLNHRKAKHEAIVEKKFQCEKCPYKTQWKHSIKKHVMTHSLVS